MKMQPRIRRFGFTVIELIVVVGVLAVLMAILLPALGSARANSRKTQELNDVRETGKAWGLYAAENGDAAVPGYIEEDAQIEWKVKFKFQDETSILPLVAEAWTWRLAPYLDYSSQVLRGYDLEGFEDPQDMMSNASALADTPAFGYNGYHIGGYMRIVNSSGTDLVRPWFGTSVVASEPARQAQAVKRTTSAIQRSSEVVVFTAASRLGGQTGLINKSSDDVEGYHLVTPPYFGTVQAWGNPAAVNGGGEVTGGFGDSTMVEIFQASLGNNHVTAVPIARHTGTTVVYRADGSADTTTPGSLADQRNFIDNASARDYQVSDDS